MAQTVVGIFDKNSNAQNAVETLVSKGFDRSNIDMSAGGKTAAGTTRDFNLDNNEQESGISKFFKNLFGDNDAEADRYNSYAAKSEAVVSVYAMSANEAEKAADILDDNGAVDLNLEAGGYDNTTMPAQGATMNTGDAGYAVTNGNTAKTNKSIPIIEESLEVGKKSVQTGGMRLKSRIVEHPVEEQLRLREETVKVNRNTVDPPATDADFAAFKEGEIEMKESKEVPVVSKQARVVEEVSLGKDVNERNETVRDTVRKTEVEVEDMKGKRISIDKSRN